MTDSDVKSLVPGTVVHEETATGCRRVVVTTTARPSRSQTHYEAWGVTDSGGMSLRITYHGQFHLASLHRRKLVTKETTR